MRLPVTITPDEFKPEREWVLEQGIDTIGVVWLYEWPTGHRFEKTPYELWTPSHRKDQPVPRFATLDEAAQAADEIAEERARTTTVKPHVVHRETYRDAEIVITFHPAAATEYGRRLAYYETRIDGRFIDAMTNDFDTVVKKLQGKVDTQRADEELAPKLRPLTRALRSVQGMPGWDDGAAPKVGDVAYVYARGMFRRGLVVAVARTRATVAYVTGSNANLVHRKADKFDQLATD